MEQILAWDFRKVIISHRDNIEQDEQEVVREARRGILGYEALPHDFTPRRALG
jgi:hypothetical protein